MATTIPWIVHWKGIFPTKLNRRAPYRGTDRSGAAIDFWCYFIRQIIYYAVSESDGPFERGQDTIASGSCSRRDRNAIKFKNFVPEFQLALSSCRLTAAFVSLRDIDSSLACLFEFPSCQRDSREFFHLKKQNTPRERENSFSSRWSNSRFKKGKEKQNKVLSTSRNFPNTKLFPRNRANDKRRSVTSPKEQSYSSPRGTRQARIDKAIGGENRGKNEEKEAEGETEGRSRRLASY